MLKAQIHHNTFGTRLPKAAVLVMANIAACLSPTQILAQAPTFDAAAIRLTDPSNVGCQYFWPDPGRFRAINATLKCLIRAAYGVQDYQIRAADGWMESQGYDIDAVAVPGITDPSRRQLVMQQLLADRFHLQFHREKREVPGYILTVGKSGPKLHEVASPGIGVSIRTGRTNGRGADLATLARVLSTHLGRPVRDATGLHGFYDFSLNWAPLSSADSDEAAPDLVAALQEQLGLKLDKGKIEIEIITIDLAEKPGQN